MSENPRDDRIATLASALIIARGAKDIQEAAIALEDAKFLLFPLPASEEYKAWQIKNGLTPTTPDEDRQRTPRWHEQARRAAARRAQ